MNIKQADRLQSLPTQFFSTMVAKVNASIAAGNDVINLGQGNPDLPTPPHIVESLRTEVLDPITHKYPPFSGMIELKIAIAQWYKSEFNVDLDPATEVAILFGGKTGLVELPVCLCNPGDAVLVPDPGYPDYWSGVALAQAEMVMMPLLRENAFLPDYSQIPKDKLDKAKIMFLNYPNNPTSATAPLSFYEDTIEFARKHNIVVASDFAYGAIGFDGEKPVSFLQAEGAKEVGVEFYTLSKTYNMAGWRVGFALGNKDVISAINLIQDHYYVSLPAFIQRAAVAALTAPQDCVHELAATYQRRRDVFVGGLREAGWDVLMPKGSFFTWVPVPKGFTSLEFSDLLLQKAHVMVAPGNGFGDSGEGYVRVGLLTSEQRLQEAVDRMVKMSL
ncbi:pyridoxal phosphate-dependent aminotransferase [Tumebacillus sp. ITR2]|uniref:Pyridoxal phosphate-dependent aminotransferase n=1 Tax=Tumebacillus amylolyticus TaxID=2801339 RepID=A0ABS1J8F3_9BACL|nr:pyridoxal phosphate-dependent aminotransferase [Tumebacillus amylolyticus]MBL0386558.1 pyridoxal phosphate-dependent aminotransferase [Tumebacillus amylolyticus]